MVFSTYKVWVGHQGLSTFSLKCHAPPDATVLRRPVSSESLFFPIKEETRLPNEVGGRHYL